MNPVQPAARFSPSFLDDLPPIGSAILLPVLVVMCLAIYGQSLSFPLIWDSLVMLADDATLHTVDPLTFFTSPTVLGVDDLPADKLQQVVYYRPILQTILSLWYQVAGDNASLWHALAVLLNCAVVVALFATLRAAGLSPWVAFAVAMLYAVNPGRVSGVAWVYSLSNQFFALFILLAFRAWLLRRWWPAWLFAVLALGSRETAVLFPLIVVAWEVLVRRERFPIGPFAGLLAMVVAYLAVRHQVTGGTDALTGVAPLTWLNTVAVIVSRHLQSMLWPVWGVRFYPFADFSSLSAQVAMGYAVLATLAGGFVYCVLRHRWLAFWMAWFGIWLAVHFNVGQFGEFLMGEKNNYLLAVSVAIFLVVLAQSLSRWLGKRAALAGLVLVVCVHAGLSAWRASHWRDPVTYYHSAIVSAPEFATLHYSLAMAHVASKTYPAAEQALLRTIELQPGHSMAWNNLGNIRYLREELAGARTAWARAFALDPGNAMAAYNLSIAETRLGNRSSAANYYRQYQALIGGR